MTSDAQSPLEIIDSVDPFVDTWAGPPFTDEQISTLARSRDAGQVLLGIVEDPGQTPTRRLTAVIALLQLGSQPWDEDERYASSVAEVLAWALRTDSIHNRWGMPGHPPGYLGALVMRLPSGARHAFEPLLDDPSRLVIVGSEAATVNEVEGYTLGELVRFLVGPARGQ